MLEITIIPVYKDAGEFSHYAIMLYDSTYPTVTGKLLNDQYNTFSDAQDGKVQLIKLFEKYHRMMTYEL